MFGLMYVMIPLSLVFSQIGGGGWSCLPVTPCSHMYFLLWGFFTSYGRDGGLDFSYQSQGVKPVGSFRVLQVKIDQANPFSACYDRSQYGRKLRGCPESLDSRFLCAVGGIYFGS